MRERESVWFRVCGSGFRIQVQHSPRAPGSWMPASELRVEGDHFRRPLLMRLTFIRVSGGRNPLTQQGRRIPDPIKKKCSAPTVRGRLCCGFMLSSLGFRLQGSGFRVQGTGFRDQGSGFRTQGSGFRVQGSRFRVQGSGFRVQDSGFKVGQLRQ